MVTGDALDTPKKTALIITAAGADYYLALKDKQSTLYAQAQQKLAHLPVAWSSDTKCAHGRIEYRELRVAASISTPAPSPEHGNVCPVGQDRSRTLVRRKQKPLAA